MPSIIIYPPGATDDQRRACDKLVREAMTEHPSRKVIRDGLRRLADDLGQFEATTHARLFTSDVTIETVLAELSRAYNEPDAYHRSNFSQTIDALLKQSA